jgi:GT2 family glycosyltransferase
MSAAAVTGKAWVAVSAFNAPDALDACLAALDRTLPAGHPVWVVDDASTDARVRPLLEHWRARTRLDVHLERLPHRLGPAANANAVFAAAGDADVVLLAADAVVTEGWLGALQRAALRDGRIATVSPWSNGTGLAAFPRPGEPNPMPERPDALAEAAAGLSAATPPPELPVAGAACMLVRRAALDALGGFDATTLGTVAADDFCRRAAAMGWRNVLCEHAFVARTGEAAGAEPGRDELPRLLARWPDYHEQVARFLLDDPLRPWRERLAARLAGLERGGPQRALFD